MTDPSHTGLTDLFASRRYFRKFETIFSHLGRVAAVMEAPAIREVFMSKTIAHFTA